MYSSVLELKTIRSTLSPQLSLSHSRCYSIIRQVISTVPDLRVDILKGDDFISLSRIFECIGYRHPDTWQPVGDDARYLLASTV